MLPASTCRPHHSSFWPWGGRWSLGQVVFVFSILYQSHPHSQLLRFRSFPVEGGGPQKKSYRGNELGFGMGAGTMLRAWGFLGFPGEWDEDWLSKRPLLMPVHSNMDAGTRVGKCPAGMPMQFSKGKQSLSFEPGVL